MKKLSIILGTITTVLLVIILVLYGFGYAITNVYTQLVHIMDIFLITSLILFLVQTVQMKNKLYLTLFCLTIILFFSPLVLFALSIIIPMWAFILFDLYVLIIYGTYLKHLLN